MFLSFEYYGLFQWLRVNKYFYYTDCLIMLNGFSHQFLSLFAFNFITVHSFLNLCFFNVNMIVATQSIGAPFPRALELN